MPDLSFELIKSIYKKYPKWSKAILFLVLGVPLIFIGCYLLGDYGIVLIHTSLSIDGLLAYYGGFLTFIGTAILGLVTITQTQKANEETEKANRRMIDLTEKQLFESKNMEKSFFIIESCSYCVDGREQFKKGYGNFSLNIDKENFDKYVVSITMKNVGNSAAVGFSRDLSLYKHSNRDGTRDLVTSKFLEVIESGNTITFGFKLTDFLNLTQPYNYFDTVMVLGIIYENIYGIKYSQSIYFEVRDSPDNCTISIMQHSPQITKTTPKEYFDSVYKTPDIEQEKGKTEP